MKNKYNFLILILMLLMLVFGCRFYNPLSDSSKTENKPATKEKSTSDNSTEKSTSEDSTDETVSDERIGIPECDELMDFFAEQTKSEDENYFVKATREFYFNKIRESIRKDLEKNKDNPNKQEEMAKNCRDYKKQLDKYKAEEDSKKSEK